MILVGDIVRLNAQQRGPDEAVAMPPQRLTWEDLNRRANAFASALVRRGVEGGDRVAILARNSPDYTALYFAAAKVGAILLPLNFWHRREELAYVLDDSEPSLVFHEADAPELLELATERGLPLLRIAGRPGAQPDDGSWAEFVASASSEDEPERRAQPESPHIIIYTSGTTGRPKGAVLSQGRTVEGALMMTAAHRLRETDTYINYFPPFHAGHWDNQILFFVLGARVVLLPQFDAGAALEWIERERVTVINAVPAMLHSLLTHESFETADLSSIRLIYYAAFDPSGIMRRTAEAFGVEDGRVEMIHTYGLTEGCPFVTQCPTEDLLSHWGSIGRPIPGAEVALLDDDCNPVPPGEAGELCLRGPHFSYYWNKPEETAEALKGGWFHTGDVAISDERGFLWLVDRKKDMIRSGGQNVYSKEVEERLLQHPGVGNVAVIGVPDPVYEESVCAVVVPAQPLPAESEADFKLELKEFVRSALAGYNVPKRVEIVDELPTNAVGKVVKHVLRQRFGSMFDASAHGVGVP